MARDSEKLVQHLITVFFSFILLITIGIIGYSQLESWSWLDALYMTFISFSTVGFQEVAPLSSGGRIFTMVIILFGMIVISMLSASVTSWFVRNELLSRRKLYKMQKKIEKLTGHIIICGGGDTGQTIMKEFRRAGKSFVVIEENSQVVEELRLRFPDSYIIHGSATKDEFLEEANIAAASGIITALPHDADNLFVVISARALNREITIISRSVEQQTESKLYNAGANYVISPKMVEGTRMASVILRPTVINFLEVMIGGDGIELRMEEVEISSGSEFAGKALLDVQIPQKTGLIVLAVKRGLDEKWYFNPKSSLVLQKKDKLIVLGESHKIDKLLDLI